MVKQKPTPKNTQVTNIKDLSDSVKRIFFSSDDDTFCNMNDLGSYVKLLFHPDGGTDLSRLVAPEKALIRTYTISEIIGSEFAIDFVMHASTLPTKASGGYASFWAKNASVGDTIQIAGPGKSAAINLNTDQTLLIADLTSLPALSHMLKFLANDITGNLFLINPDSSFTPSVTLPSGVILTEFSNFQPFQAFMQKEFQWTQQSYSVWCACEYTIMRFVRQQCSAKLSLQKQHCYFSSYWKQGMTEDGHKIFKQQDAIKINR